MKGPNKKLDPDMTVYADNMVLKMACRKGSDYLESVNAESVSSIRGLDVKLRWICCGINGSGKHVNMWATPREVISAELRGESGCVHCRDLAVEETVTRAEFDAGCKAQEEARDKSNKKALRAVFKRSNNYGLARY